MRLYNIYYLCRAAISGVRHLKLQNNIYPGSGRDYTILNWKDAVQSYDVVRKLSFLQEDVKKILSYVPAHQFGNAKPTISVEAGENIEKENTNLLSKLTVIVDLYESLDTGEAQQGIDIKIPSCESFKEYIQYMKDIDFIFSQCPFISQSDEEIVFNTVDVGSMWLSFFIKAKAGKHIILSSISKLSEVAIKIKSNYTVTKMQDEMLVSMKQKNEIGQEVIDVFKKMKDKMLDDAVSEMESECDLKLKNEEDRDRARRSIDMMATLIDKGVEIYSAIETPEEIKVQFPFSENAPTLPAGLQKLLEKKQDEDNE